MTIFSYPFDWRNPFGYMLATIYIFCLLSYSLVLISGVASFGIGCYILANTTSTELKTIIQKTNKKLRLKSQRSLALDRFIDLVEWHAKCKELSIDLILEKIKETLSFDLLALQAHHQFRFVFQADIHVGVLILNNHNMLNDANDANGNSLVHHS